MTTLKHLPLKNQMLLFLASSILIIAAIQLFYYFSFYGMIQNNAKTYAANIVRQVSEKLSSNADIIEKAAKTVGYSSLAQEIVMTENPKELIWLDNAVISMLSYIVESNPMISDIAIANDGVRLTSLRRSISPLVYDMLYEQYDMEGLTSPVFTRPVPLRMNAGVENYYLYIMPVYDASGLSVNRKIAHVIVVCRLEGLSGIVKDTEISENSLLSVIDDRDVTVVSNQRERIGERFELSKPLGEPQTEGDIVLHQADRDTIMQSALIKAMQWKVVSQIPVNELTSPLNGVGRTGTFITLFLIAAQLVIGLLMFRSIMKPISEIIRSMKGVGDTDLKARIRVKVLNEIGSIAGHINRMLDKIENLTVGNMSIQSRVFELELLKREAELASLQSQINPHFLYNTLDCIRSISLVRDVPEVVDISTSMAHIYRYSIKGDFFTTIRKELECVMHYMTIMEIRFGGRFKSDIRIGEELMDRQVIIMILQPIVENAIYHGLEPKSAKGLLTVDGKERDGMLELTVRDDGVGMNEAELVWLNRKLSGEAPDAGRLPSDSSRRSIGLANINSRIKLYYGEQGGIRVDSKEGEGTIVMLRIPIQAEASEVAPG